MSRKRALRRKQDAARYAAGSAAEPAGGGVQAIIDLTGEPIHALFDDCPICQALRDSGEPVFTIGASGELVPIDVSRSRRAD